ncbi:hypothetical protein CALCODRAFT_507263 [Calocera cornea HHB12733]|uniref:Uncharacterized protein n=1 Tax=Calocera cornea HHB12733 TaxID=1353952 RepID=A0A165HYK3_9BASI|nr:hypothetical protein CALCODRAFT_507263 [Calocera cornea HHB12733]
MVRMTAGRLGYEDGCWQGRRTDRFIGMEDSTEMARPLPLSQERHQLDIVANQKAWRTRAGTAQRKASVLATLSASVTISAGRMNSRDASGPSSPAGGSVHSADPRGDAWEWTDVEERINTEFPARLEAIMSALGQMFRWKEQYEERDKERTEREMLDWSGILNPAVSFYYNLGMSDSHPACLTKRIDDMLAVVERLYARGLKSPMNAGRGLNVKQLPDSYFLRSNCFSNVRNGSRPYPNTIWKSDGSLNVSYIDLGRSGSEPMRKKLGPEERLRWATAKMVERYLLLLGDVPDIKVQGNDYHLHYQICAKSLWVRVSIRMGEIITNGTQSLLRRAMEALRQTDHIAGTLYLYLFRLSIHARKAMCFCRVSIDNTILSDEFLPMCLRQYALGRTPSLWGDVNVESRRKAEKDEWWHWTRRSRKDAIEGVLDRHFGENLLSVVMPDVKWESQPPVAASSIFLDIALDAWIKYCILCATGGIGASARMCKALEVHLRTLNDLLESRPNEKLPIPLNILLANNLPEKVLSRCPNLPDLELLTYEELDRAYWARKLKSAKAAYDERGDLFEACGTIGLFYAAYDVGAAEALGSSCNETAMVLLHAIRRAIETKTAPAGLQEEAPDVLIVPRFIRQQFTPAYPEYSNAMDIASTRALLHKSAKPRGKRRSSGDANDESTEDISPIASRHALDDEVSEPPVKGSSVEYANEMPTQDAMEPVQGDDARELSQDMNDGPLPHEDTDGADEGNGGWPVGDQVLQQTEGIDIHDDGLEVERTVADASGDAAQDAAKLGVGVNDALQQQNRTGAPDQTNDFHGSTARRRRTSTPMPSPELQAPNAGETSLERINLRTRSRRRAPGFSRVVTDDEALSAPVSERTRSKRKRRREPTAPEDDGPLDASNIDVEMDPRRKDYAYYQGNDFSKRTIFKLLPRRSKDEVRRTWCRTDEENFGRRITPKQMLVDRISVPEMRRVGCTELGWPGEEVTTAKTVKYVNEETGELTEEFKRLEFCEDRGENSKCTECTVTGSNCFVEMLDMSKGKVAYWAWQRAATAARKNTEAQLNISKQQDEAETEEDTRSRDAAGGDKDAVYHLGRKTKRNLIRPSMAKMWERKKALLNLQGDRPVTKSAKQVQVKKEEEEEEEARQQKHSTSDEVDETGEDMGAT